MDKSSSLWGTASGKAWDFMPTSMAEFYEHEGVSEFHGAYGQLDPMEW